MIIFAADLHLCKRVWRARKDLEGDSFRALRLFQDEIIRLNQEEPVTVVIGGDIFDKNAVRGAALNAFTNFVDELYEHSIEIYTIQGNHDNDPDLSIAEIQGTKPLHENLVTLDNRRVYGLDWMVREDLQQALKNIPETDILVLHAMAEPFMNFEAAADFTMDDVPLFVRHVLVGDIHVNEIFEYHGGVCVSPGPLHPTKIDQEGPFGFYSLAAGADAWVRHNIQSREIRRFAMMSEDDVGSIEKALPMIESSAPDGYAPIVEIKYIAELSEVVDRWTDKFKGICFFTKPSAKGKILSRQDLEEAQESFQELSLEGSLHMVVDESEQKELYGFLHSCLQGNAQDVVEKRVEEACAQSN